MLMVKFCLGVTDMPSKSWPNTPIEVVLTRLPRPAQQETLGSLPRSQAPLAGTEVCATPARGHHEPEQAPHPSVRKKIPQSQNSDVCSRKNRQRKRMFPHPTHPIQTHPPLSPNQAPLLQNASSTATPASPPNGKSSPSSSASSHPA